jgi:hypothetical protein
MSQIVTQVFHVGRPAVGAAKTVLAYPKGENNVIELDFDAFEIDEVARSGDNLVFIFGDGSSITIEHYYALRGNELPSFHFTNAAISNKYNNEK